MIALYLLAAHLLGDFVFQTRWQAAEKLNDRALRKRHVWAYAVPFIPIATWRSWGGSTWHEQRGVVFICLLVLLHFATDSGRFHSTLGDCVAWRLIPQDERWLIWRGHEIGERRHALALLPEDVAERVVRRWPPPNPWAPIPILIDQTLHVCQLALLGGLFLS